MRSLLTFDKALALASLAYADEKLIQRRRALSLIAGTSQPSSNIYRVSMRTSLILAYLIDETMLTTLPSSGRLVPQIAYSQEVFAAVSAQQTGRTLHTSIRNTC